MKSLIAPAINLGLLLVILFWKGREPVRTFVRDRHVRLRDDIDSVRDLLRRSQERYNEFSGKLQSLDAEVTALRTQMKQDAQAMRTRIVEDAKKQCVQIGVDAKASAQSLVTDLKSGLYRELATKVMDRAEKLLRERLTGDDRARIRQEFSKQVEVAR